MFHSGQYVDDDYQRRLDQILVDVKSLEDLINDIQSPKKTSDNEVNEKIKVRWICAVMEKNKQNTKKKWPKRQPFKCLSNIPSWCFLTEARAHYIRIVRYDGCFFAKTGLSQIQTFVSARFADLQF